MMQPHEKRSLDIVREAIEQHSPIKIYVGISGGKDSMTVGHFMMNNIPGCEVFHLNTGIGIEATRVFVRETCAALGWPLTEIRAKEDAGQDYEKLVMEFGFPGPGGHGLMYRRLKERSVRVLVKRVKQKRLDRVLLATGIYKEESRRRSNYDDRIINRNRSQVWMNPLYYWTKEQFAEYRERHNVPINPVSKTLGMSGECLCGAFAHKGEKALIRLVCPKTADYIEDLERRVFEAGHEWGWEDRPPKKKRRNTGSVGILCQGCEK